MKMGTRPKPMKKSVLLTPHFSLLTFGVDRGYRFPL